MNKRTEKLTVWAPMTPGAIDTIVVRCSTIAEAREVAERFSGRKDLSYQSVYVRIGATGQIIERCGPAR